MRRLLILDLDETLFHTRHHPLRTFPFWQRDWGESKYAKQLDRLPPDAVMEDANFRYACYKRPGLDEFISQLLELPLDLAVWTSSTAEYAEHFLAQMFPASFRDELVFVWARKQCSYKKSFWTKKAVFLKDLDEVPRQFPEYSIGQIMCVDDTPQKLRKHPTNHLLIPAWFGDLRDQELASLISYLKNLPDTGDLRSWKKQNWQKTS